MEILEHPGAIAIIGMAGRFPGARDVEQFRKNLEKGVESITFFSDEELLAQGVPLSRLNEPNYVKAAPLLDDYDLFDASFFEYSPRDAELMDPQHRILLECAWEALENAGYAPRPHAHDHQRQANHSSRTIGVFAGAGGLMSSYLLSETHVTQRLRGETGSREHIGNDKDYLSTRVSYKLNLQGPSLTIQTACSTSLVAVHLACQSLLNGECDMALAGGVSIRVPQRMGYMFREGDIVSPDGHCRPFDADSQGTIFGSGVGLVLLKPLEDAIRDGDSIDAVIRGSAINNDGGQKVSYWATLAEGQADAISQALAVAEVEPETIGYVETHGTGTFLGDPVEILALSKAFGSTEKQFCAIGSVKSNIGHLEAASGVAGLIKAVLSLKHKKFYPSLHFSTPNPRIKFEKTPFFVNTTLSEWVTTAFPRRAAVNSLGIGGTNAHLIIEEAPQVRLSTSSRTGGVFRQAQEPGERPLHLLTLSAKSPEALQALLSRYRQHIAAQPTQAFADLCYTANTGRVHFEHRFALRAASSEEALEALDHALNQPDLHNPLIKRGQVQHTEPVRIAFLFTGQGSQYVEMGRELYESEPIFRQTLERCDEILRPHLDRPLLEVLYPERKSTIEHGFVESSTACPLGIDDTAYTQPALFALEYGLAELWKSWGIEPFAVMGHSVGEYVAACVAGVFSLEDGLKLVAARGRLMQELPHASRGAMVAIFTSEAQVEELLTAIEGHESVSIAAINGPQNVVISGERDVVHAIVEQVERQGIRTQELTVSHAFHSPLMEPMLADFAQVASQVRFAPPPHTPRSSTQPRLLSNITGELASAEVATPAYWVRHITAPVRFADSISTLHQLGYNVFIEIGPKSTLLGMARRILPANYGTWLPTLRQSDDSAWAQLLDSLAELYVRGAKIDWFGFDQAYASRRQRLHLPTYPFQRKRYWLESRADTSPDVEGAAQKQGAYHARRVHLSPLIDKLMQLPRHKEIVCETTFSVTRLPFLADHRVFGEIISPGACQLAMVLEAAQLAYPQETRKQGAHWVLVDTVLPQPLLLADADAERTVQVVFRSPSASREAGIAFELISFIAKASFGAAEQADETLQIHASGALTPNPLSCPLGAPNNGRGEISVDIASLQRRCPVAVDLELFDAHAAAQQVHYGPSFRWLAEVWRGEGEVIARLRLPTALSEFDTQRGEYQLHPALLAACLRITDAVKLSDKESLTLENTAIYMPFALDSFKLLGEIKGGDWWCHTQRARCAELVDEEQWHIRLMDEVGTVLAQIEGYSERKASGQLFLGGEARPEWFYEVQWQPQVRFFLPPTYLPNLTTLSQVVQREGAKSLTAPTVQQQIVALRELDALAVDYILEAFAKAGVRFKAGSEWQSQELARQLGVIPTYRRLLSRLLQILSEAAILRPIPEVEGWQVLRTPQLRSPQDELERLRREYGALIEAEGDLLARCANNLSAVLRGRQEPLELLFPNGDATLVNRIYQDSPIALAMNRMLQEAVKSALSQLPAGQGVRILEIGAGTGGTTAGILPLLPSGQTDYLFTDIGATFLLAAQKKFADYSFVRYQRLDIEQSPAEQGLELYQYDIVIAANVLHATADLSTTLAHVHTLLKPGGLLLLLETTTPANRVDLTFGLTDGWWRFTDHDLRPDYPLLSAKKWCDLLSDTQRARCNGFSQASAIPLDEEAQALLPGQVVILARRAPEKIEQAVQPLGQWLILADENGVGEKISRHLRDRGEQSTLVYLGEAYQFAPLLRDQKREKEELTLSNTRADFERLLREIGATSPLRGVIHCWSLDATADETSPPEELELATEQGCGSALYLAQALLKEGVTPALWLLTQGAQAVAARPSPLTPLPMLGEGNRLREEGLTGVIQSTLWGLGKVIALEHPELHCKLVDLEPLMSADESEAQVEALVEQLLATVCPLGKEPFPSQSWGGLRGGAESQLAFRQGQWYVPRLLPVPANGKGEQLREGAGYRADATYLIVGGTRGIGFEIAQWMVEQGAKNLVLVGRHAPDAATQEVINQLVADTDGLQVRAAQADVSKKEQIANVLTEIEQTMPPLRGIIHSAGIFDDRLVRNHEWELFRKVFAAKVTGTWNLHTLTKVLPLDFFVLFSSTASLLGLAGLSNYAAANAFLDAFAHHRHTLGLPALSINWGAWKEVGMAATVGKERERQWEMMGFAQMAQQEALAAFEEALKRDMPQVGIFPITWSKFLSDQGTNRHFSFFEAFRQDLQTETPLLPSVANPSPQGRGESPINTETNVQAGLTFRTQLEASIEGKRYSLLAAHVKTVVMEILGLEPTTLLSRRQGFFELGMDSLMTIEFRNRLQLTLEMDLPSTLLFKYSTLGTLIDYLADVLGIELRDAPRGTIPKGHAVTDAPAKESGPPLPALGEGLGVRAEAIDDLDNATADKLARLESLLKEI